ncbi:TipAS antibiotic-recognition domain-containing protein [Streptomyces sp.]|uniref:TipAS antibiotic-recognition domain-containing protein n=1 Tax=Streptomyces sp. TaxID=1931 RepID=UPI002D7A3401|nr:TipAS antibiotic-recognition domain-containing protein [Streptomyces sp.]HET6354560.1 TipAS antibiotic-recognition domain-containing protein [Streptomyces sp.]
MHKRVSMSDDDRHQLIDEFWDEVSSSQDVRHRRAFVEWSRQARPKLPEEPTTAQLEAWIELADLVQDPDFRRAVRESLEEPHAPSQEESRLIQAHREASQEFRESFPAEVPTTTRPTKAELEQCVKKGSEILREVHAAYQAGLVTDSPQAQDLADRYVACIAEASGVQDHSEMRRRMAAVHTNAKIQGAMPLALLPSPRLGPRFIELRRYFSLLATINGELQAEEERAAYGWLMAAVCVPGSRSEPGTGNWVVDG